MNLGIAAAKGEYIGIVESDDYIALNMYEELYAIAKEKNVEIIKSDIYNFYDKETREFKYQPIAYDKKFYHKNLYFESAGASYQDTGFWFITIISAYSIYFYRKAYYYRQDNISSSCNSKAKVYCLCNEYDFIRSSLNKKEEFVKEYVFILAYLRFGGYCWNMNRIEQKFYLEFLERFQKYFQKIVNNNELNHSLFSSCQLEILDLICKIQKLL